MKLPGMKLLFIFGNDEYKKGKKKGKTSKYKYKSSLRQEGTAEARRVQSACSLSNVTDKNRSPIQQRPDTPPKKNKKNSILPRVIIPRNKTNDEYRNTDSTYRLVITIF